VSLKKGWMNYDQQYIQLLGTLGQRRLGFKMDAIMLCGIIATGIVVVFRTAIKLVIAQYACCFGYQFRILIIV
jgi:hypothetical protein